jgi:hypothetical protein
MAEETKPAAAAETQETAKVKKKKLRPTNCAQSNKRIRRKDWYFRNGKYFANKKAFQLFSAQEKSKKEKEAAAKAAAPAAGEAQTA